MYLFYARLFTPYKCKRRTCAPKLNYITIFFFLLMLYSNSEIFLQIVTQHQYDNKYGNRYDVCLSVLSPKKCRLNVMNALFIENKLISLVSYKIHITKQKQSLPV